MLNCVPSLTNEISSGYQSEVAGPSGLQDVTLEEMPSDIMQPYSELNPLQDMTLIEEVRNQDVLWDPQGLISNPG